MNNFRDNIYPSWHVTDLYLLLEISSAESDEKG